MAATTCRIIHSDLSDDGFVFETGSPVTTWTPGLANLQDPLMSAIARTTILNGAQLGIRFASNVNVTGFAVVGTNLSQTASFRITAATGSPSTEIYNSGLLGVYTGSKTLIDPDEKGFSFHHLPASVVTASEFVLELNDPTNVDGVIEVSRFMIGTVTASDFGFWDGSEFSRDHNTTVLTSVGGTRFYNKHRNIRRWSMQFPQESYNNAWNEFDRMFELNGMDRFVYIIGYPDDIDRMPQHSFMGTFEATSPLRQMASLRVGTGYDVVEHI